jgi:hypothetical protein
MSNNSITKAIRAVHLRVDSSESTDNLIQYMKEGLAPLGVNTLIIEINPGYNFQCYPELANGSFGKEDAQKVAAAARETGIRIVPLFMCLGHQGWRFHKNTLLKLHPEFDETPNIPEDGDPKKTPDTVFYCHSWCASNDDVYKYVFPMIDEIMTDFGTDCLHVGMDEVFSMADENCPRCKGKDRAELFARTVNILHDHIVKEKGWQMMMWADRLNHAEECGYHDWEGDMLGTWPAIDKIPNDILLADWHYEMNKKKFPSIRIFAEKGFTVIPAAWRSLKQTRYFLEDALKRGKLAKENGAPGCMAGMIITNWASAGPKHLEELLALLKERVQDDKDKGIRGIASSIIYMTEKLKNYTP